MAAQARNPSAVPRKIEPATGLLVSGRSFAQRQTQFGNDRVNGAVLFHKMIPAPDPSTIALRGISSPGVREQEPQTPRAPHLGCTVATS